MRVILPNVGAGEVKLHRLADKPLAWTTKVCRPTERFIGQPMKLTPQ
jgi:hypothetical protein